MQPDPSFDEYHSLWSKTYDKGNYDRGLAAYFLRKSHAWCEHPFGPAVSFSRVLEVGAGTGMHLGYVRHRFDEYLVTDASEQTLEYARNRDRLRPMGNGAIRYGVEDATKLSFADAQFDRLIAAHVLEHLPDPHRVLREWVRVVRPGGIISLLLPCDPGMAWRLGRTLGPRATFTKAGIAYDYWMAREHINAINNLVAMCRYYFPVRSEQWFPMRVPSMDINLFFIAHLTV